MGVTDQNTLFSLVAADAARHGILRRPVLLHVCPKKGAEPKSKSWASSARGIKSIRRWADGANDSHTPNDRRDGMVLGVLAGNPSACYVTAATKGGKRKTPLQKSSLEVRSRLPLRLSPHTQITYTCAALELDGTYTSSHTHAVCRKQKGKRPSSSNRIPGRRQSNLSPQPAPLDTQSKLNANVNVTSCMRKKHKISVRQLPQEKKES
jgi:hypothetical protein